MGATLNLVPRALSLALEPKPGKSALGTRSGATLSEWTKEVYVPRSHKWTPLCVWTIWKGCAGPLWSKKKISLCLIYPASRVSFPIFLGSSKETLLACRVPLIRPHPNNRSINHFQGKLLLCLYGWKILNIVSTSKNKERTAERTVFPDNLTCSKESLGADIPLVPLPSDPEVESYLSWARVKPACEVTLKTSFSCFPLLLVFKVHRNPQTFGFIFHDNVNPSFDWLKHNTNQYRYQSWLNSDFFKNPA